MSYLSEKEVNEKLNFFFENIKRKDDNLKNVYFFL